MPFFKRLLTLLSPEQPAVPPATTPSMPDPLPVSSQSIKVGSSVDSPATPVTQFSNETTAEPLPDWLSNDDSLRDEGTLFGLSTARPDEKIAAIRAYFGQQTVLLQERISQHAEVVSELNGVIAQCQTRLDDLENRVADFHDQQPQPVNLIHPVVGLGICVGLGIGTFYLIDESLHPIYPNQWIAIGVFLAGVLNGLIRLSVGAGEKTPLAGYILLQEVGLPLAASGFVLAQIWQTHPILYCAALFLFIFFVFWQGGKRLFDTLTRLNQALTDTAKNRRSVVDSQQNKPAWEAESERLRREIEAMRAEKRPFVMILNRTETELAQLIVRRDRLVNLFLSEFELARSLRDQLSSQQREAVLRSYKVNN